jgi:hypothetical protein
MDSRPQYERLRVAFGQEISAEACRIVIGDNSTVAMGCRFIGKGWPWVIGEVNVAWMFSTEQSQCQIFRITP